jgi:hypothetical protein
MTTVNLSRIVPGQTTDVTASPSPNTTITSLNSASAAIDLNNLGIEGIDWRNIKLPLIDVGSVSGVNGGPMNRHESGTIELGFISGWTSVGTAGELQFDISDYYAIAVRASFRVYVEGQQAPQDAEQPEVGFRFVLGSNMHPLTGTERWWQCALNRAAHSDIPDSSDSAVTTSFDPRLRATTTIHYVSRAAGLRAFAPGNQLQISLEANVLNFHGVSQADFTINDLNMHCVGYREGI